MIVDSHLILLEQFAAGLLVGGFIRTALTRPAVSAVIFAIVILAFLAWMMDPACRAAQCALDGALTCLADAIAWWISKPAFALGWAVGFAIAMIIRNPSSA